MAWLWISPSGSSIVSSTRPGAAVACVEIDNGLTPDQVYLSADGTAQPVPPCPLSYGHFRADLGAWVDPRDEAEAWTVLRVLRDSRLTVCDWTQIPDAPLTEPQRAAWAAYRQSLRDLPATVADPRNPEWPLPPAE